MSNKLLSLLVVFVLYPVSPTFAEVWDIREKSLGAAIAYEDKTTDTKFEGTKLFLDGSYFFNSKEGETSDIRKCCTLPSQPEYYYGVLNAQLRIGLDGTGLE